MNKKAQGISINVIIVAAIALLVLVVLSVIFLGKLGIFTKVSADCEQQGNTCTTQLCEDVGATSYPALTCPKTSSGQSQNCCVQGTR